MLKKTTFVTYGVGAYLLFLVSFLYLIAFATNVVPNTATDSRPLSPLLAALIDVALIVLFGLQHGIMARPAFKRWWTRFVPRELERSTFVWFAAILLIILLLFWQPIQGELWNVTGAGMIAMYAISLLGFLTVPVVSFLTGHFELFGLRQVFEYAFGKPQSEPVFKERALYKRVRHPMMLGFLIAFWANPHMTAGYFLFAVLMTAYILVGIFFEERDLVSKHGRAYRDYQARVPKLLPLAGAKPVIKIARSGGYTGPTRGTAAAASTERS